MEQHTSIFTVWQLILLAVATIGIFALLAIMENREWRNKGGKK